MIIKALAIAAAFSVQSTYAGGDTSIYGIAKSTPDEFSTLVAAVDAAGLVHTSGIPDNEKRTVKEYRERLYDTCKQFGPARGETDRQRLWSQ